MKTLAYEKLGKRYAKAFFENVSGKKDVHEIYEQVLLLSEMLVTEPLLLRTFTSAIVSDEIKEKIAKALVTKWKWHKELQRFLSLIIVNGREFCLPAALREFANLYREKEGIMEAEVRTAVELGTKQKTALTKWLLAQRKKKKLLLSEQVDEQMGAGVWIRTGVQVYDARVKTKLGRVREALSAIE